MCHKAELRRVIAALCLFCVSGVLKKKAHRIAPCVENKAAALSRFETSARARRVTPPSLFFFPAAKGRAAHMHGQKKKEADMWKRNSRGMILYKPVTTNFSSSSSSASAAQTQRWLNKRQGRIHFTPRGAIRSRLSLPADICGFGGENITRNCSAFVNIHQVDVSAFWTNLGTGS